MKACKDCLYYHICEKFDGPYIHTHINECLCEDFDDKSNQLRSPCKLGSTVYKVIADKRVKRPWECEVVGFWYSKNPECNNIYLVHYTNGVFESSFSVPFTEIGKSVFLTKEEAEKAQKKRKSITTRC